MYNAKIPQAKPKVISKKGIKAMKGTGYRWVALGSWVIELSSTTG
ncbi:MAG: hypothetical protein RH949_06090 [Coleofasciculus sp. A1-SPW-01]